MDVFTNSTYPKTYPQTDKAIYEPLTDNRTAETLKDNVEKLIEIGREPDISHLIYIKLNKYEQDEILAKTLEESTNAHN